MTLVCVWLDNTFGTPRFTALADMRISRAVSDQNRKVAAQKREAISDLTVKLFAIEVNSYLSTNIVPPTGYLSNPYHKSMIGVAFSGRCLEALSVIAHMQRLLPNLIADQRDSPVELTPGPTAVCLTNWVRELLSCFFAAHADRADPTLAVTLILFGWDDGQPWISKLKYSGVDQSVSCDAVEGVADAFVSTGEDSTHVTDAVQSLREAVSRHKRKLSVGIDEDSNFTHQREKERHELAELKAIEGEIAGKLSNSVNESIGGTLQKLELLPTGRWSATRMAGEYGVPMHLTLSPSGVLVPLDLTQRMGPPVSSPKVFANRGRK